MPTDTQQDKAPTKPAPGKRAELDMDQLDHVAGGRKPPVGSPGKGGDPCDGGE